MASGRREGQGQFGGGLIQDLFRNLAENQPGDVFLCRRSLAQAKPKPDFLVQAGAKMAVKRGHYLAEADSEVTRSVLDSPFNEWQPREWAVPATPSSLQTDWS